MTLEHVWPQALGGADAPWLFKTRDVCQTCNNIAGQWVDGAFLKSYFITHERAIAARRFLDPVRPGILPLIYIGIDQEFPVQKGESCERWIGPAGEHIYHVHQSDPDKWFSYAGGDFLRRKRSDPGRAYIDLTASHPYWLITGIHSFVSCLRPARLFLATICQGLPDQLTQGLVPESQATPIEASELAWIRNRPIGTNSPFRMPLRIDFSDRFLAKLALGLGHNIIGSAFQASPYAAELRKLFWRREPNGGEDIQVFGTGYWQADQFDALSKLVGLRGAWTLLLQALREGLSISLCTPGGRMMTMVITNDTSLLTKRTLERYHLGELYFAIPQRRMFIGPVELPRYLAHRGGSSLLPELVELEALSVDQSVLPPRHSEAAIEEVRPPSD